MDLGDRRGIEGATERAASPSRRRWLGLAVALAAAATAAVADFPGVGPDPLSPEERAYLRAHGPVRYAPDPSFAPFEFFDPTGKAVGITPDLLALISLRLGIEISSVRYPSWPAVLAAARRGEIDLLGTLTRTPEREGFLAYGEPYLWVSYALFVREDRPDIRGLGEVGPGRLGVVDSYGVRHWLATEHPGIAPVLVQDPVSALTGAAAGQLDAVLEAQPVGLYAVAHSGLRNVRLVPAPVPPTPQHFAVPQGREVLLGILAKGLATLTPWDRTEVFVRWTGQDLSLPPPGLPRGAIQTLAILGALVVLGTAWIVTLRRSVDRQTRSLRESEERYRLLATNVRDVIWTMDLAGRFTYVSPSVEGLRGFRPEEVIGKSLRDILTPESWAVAEADLAGVLARDARGEDLEPPPLTLELPRKDGSTVWVEVVVGVVRDAAGVPVGVQGATRDITERRQAEAEKAALEGQVREAQKMEAIGTLAGGVAHDFNNVLTAVLGYAELSLLEVREGSRVQGYLDGIVRSACRARDVVRQILALSRRAPQQRRPVDLSAAVHELLGLLRATLPTTIEIRERLDPDAGCVLADPTQLDQVLLNLCTNAHHAMKTHGGVLEVTVERTSGVEPGEPPGDGLRLTVRDTGIGMDTATLARVFEPYFTTKGIGEGSGLGLAVVHGIVTGWGGRISVTSEPGRGSTFEVRLPRETAAAEAAVPPPNGALPRGTERVLVVDDEPTLTEVLQGMLEALGYRVTVTNDSGDALAKVRAAPGAFDLVITDQTMPHLTGAALTRELLRLRPDLPVLLYTGHGEVLDQAGAREAGARGLLHKPVAWGDLARAVRGALDG